MTPCYYCEADGVACKTCTHSDTYIDPQEEITKLREQVAAQAAEIARLKTVPMKYRRMQFNAELQEEVARLREQVKAQTAVIEKLRTFVQHVAKQIPEKPDYWSSCGQCSSNSSEAEDLLEIPTDSTQILDEVRRAEREKCAKVCDENHWDDHRLFAEKIRAME